MGGAKHRIVRITSVPLGETIDFPMLGRRHGLRVVTMFHIGAVESTSILFTRNLISESSNSHSFGRLQHQVQLLITKQEFVITSSTRNTSIGLS